MHVCNMLQTRELQKARSATQFIFLVCGIGMASWAPMVPYAKDRLGLDDAQLGLLLLLLGGGALLTMPLSGVLVNRFGSRAVMMAAIGMVAVTLPLLLLLPSVTAMAVTLFLFGAGIGTTDVAMNAHGVQVQNLYGRPIMSSLHGLFSVGGLVGSLGLGFLIKLGLPPIDAAISIAVLLAVIAAIQYKRLLTSQREKEAVGRFSAVEGDQPENRGQLPWLHGSVLFLGVMCFVAFLSEGAMLDWGAVFLRDVKGVSAELSGAGYAAFSIAMAAMRLLGDGIVTRMSGEKVVIYGSLIGAAGLCLTMMSPWVLGALAGFVLLGIGAANIVPVFFSEAGRLPGIPPAIGIPAITTMGYAGQLAGPALLGFIAFYFSLPTAFGFLALMLVGVAVAFSMKRSREARNDS